MDLCAFMHVGLNPAIPKVTKIGYVSHCQKLFLIFRLFTIMKTSIVSIALIAAFAIMASASGGSPSVPTGNLTNVTLLPLNTSHYIENLPARAGNLTIGALLPLTGSLTLSGQADLAALGMAEQDVNDTLSGAGKELRIKLVVKDTGTNPNTTLSELKDLQAQGINIVIGPETSASLSQVRGYANQNGIILISHASIASSLAIANDTTFRLTPDDRQLGMAIADLMHGDGIRVIIPMDRGDVWGKELLNATAAAFSSQGGTTMNPILFNPDAGNFSAKIDTVGKELRDALRGHDNRSVAVYLLSFEEGAAIMSQSQAMNDPILSSVRWYGGDGSAVTFSDNPAAARFAKMTRFVFPRYGNGRSETFLRLKKRLEREPDTENVNVYDALWLAIQTYAAAGSDKSEIFKNVLPKVSDSLMGSYGSLALNAAGDREFANYEFLTLERVNGGLQWVPIARYTSGPGLSTLLTSLPSPMG
jgi:branched-chain amino acid transport system substrate-binding protein